MDTHPLSPERRIGHVYQVEGSFVDVMFSAANKLPKSHYGERLGRGEVGEFVVIDVGDVAVFGRLLRVGVYATRAEDLLDESEHNAPVLGRVQLLSTLQMNGESMRGISRYPKVGDAIFAANSEAILAVIGAAPELVPSSLRLGRLSIDESVPVDVPLARLFGRHTAIVGATGSGKSWTLGHLAESVGVLGGKLILIDATGEFRTLGASAKHLSFGTTDNEPPGATLVGIPHYMMRETDRNTFLSPSSGLQLPKLREAVRTLKLVRAIADDPSPDPLHVPLAVPAGPMIKSGTQIHSFQSAMAKYISVVEHPHTPFHFRALADQVQNECIYANDRINPNNFGNSNAVDLGYVSSLVSRINDLLQTPEVMGVIDPDVGTSDVISEMEKWICDPSSHILRVSLRNLTFTNSLREIVVNILGQTLLGWARAGRFQKVPLIVAVDEAHQFFDVTVGDEFASTHLNAFDAIAKEGRKYGLTVCVATQRPGDLPSGVLSQVGMTIVHRLADGRDRQRIEQAAAEIDQSATKLLPGLVPGEAILMGVEFPVPVSIRVQKPIAPPASDGPDYDAWAAHP